MGMQSLSSRTNECVAEMSRPPYETSYDAVYKIKSMAALAMSQGLNSSCVHHALAAMSTASSLAIVNLARPCRHLPHTPEMGDTMHIL